MPFRQITIIGTGLIGGSFGLALRKRKFAGRIVGCDREATLAKARDRGAIDEGSPNPGDAMRGSQVVVLATPVLGIIDLIERVGSVLPSKALLTDVGSTKSAVVQQAQKVFGKNAGKRFLAGHPMAGKELSGVDFADPDLFEKAVWFFTPLPEQNLNEGVFAEFAGIDRSDRGARRHASGGGARSTVRMDQPCSADDLDRSSGSSGRGVRGGGSPTAYWRSRSAGDDADLGESVFDVAGRRHQQPEESGGCFVEGGTAACAYPGESGDTAVGGRV